jgi:hypothetical protein
MDWPTATVLIVLIVAWAVVRICRDWRGHDDGNTADAIGFFQDRDDTEQ